MRRGRRDLHILSWETPDMHIYLINLFIHICVCVLLMCVFFFVVNNIVFFFKYILVLFKLIDKFQFCIGFLYSQVGEILFISYKFIFCNENLLRLPEKLRACGPCYICLGLLKLPGRPRNFYDKFLVSVVLDSVHMCDGVVNICCVQFMNHVK